ncbi:putative transmembrane protein [Tieghemostelium lacteum]|uniref:Putative transmembrane protein n=1 Tax=Tieghemostelium lacteum TaxID=361077 RepID=A0A151ZD60_TIELA|nr:putative transmembrane protein [Tieghemostelium lacteum]|eukprot:KYQ91892.1 putative transmembrane protein [Tieghemostelium lacteum]
MSSSLNNSMVMGDPTYEFTHINCSEEGSDCTFCQTIFTRSFNIIGNGEAGSVVFNALTDTMALGYIVSALYLLFRLQRSYSHLQKGNESPVHELTHLGKSNKKSHSGSSNSKSTTNNNNKYINIDVNDGYWEKEDHMGITINHPKIINTTYFKYILFVSIWLAFEGLLVLFLPATSMVYPTAVIIVGCGHVITDNWVLIFLYGKEDDKFSARRSFYSSTLLYLIITTTSLAAFFDNQKEYLCEGRACEYFTFQDPYTMLSISMAALIVYIIVLVMTLRKSLLRPTARIWLLFQIVTTLLYAIAYMLIIFKVGMGFCFLGLATGIYSFSYGALLFRTCGSDSDLLRARSEFLPLLNNFQEYTSLFGRESIMTSGEGATTALQLSAFYIRYNEFKFGNIIGEGYFGEVRKAIWKGAMVAVKILHRNSFRNTDNTEENVFLKEVAILSLLRHPNVLQFLGVCSESNQNCIVTEYMGGGSLDRMIADRYHIFVNKPILAWKFSLDIAKGMYYLHDWKPNPILHRDLSTKNILLDESFSVAKVADFGLSREQGFEMTASVGYLPFQAPEVFIGELYTPKADVYSFGILLWCILTGEQPNQNLQPLKMAHMAAYENYRPPLLPLKCQSWDPLLNLVQMCWKSDPESRPSFSFILDFLEANMPTDQLLSYSNNSLNINSSNSSSSNNNNCNNNNNNNNSFSNSNNAIGNSINSTKSITVSAIDEDDEIFSPNDVHYIDD